ncbi:MAG: hypothetical protein WAP74_04790 [Patescibacteria group bacterium]
MKKSWADRVTLLCFGMVAVAGFAQILHEEKLPNLEAGKRLHGLSVWIWILKDAEHGELGNVIKRCRDVRINAVLIKVNDGRQVITPEGRCEPVDDVQNASCQLTRELVNWFHSAGVAVHGWSMMYGGDCGKEIAFAVHALHTLGADGFVFDTEGFIKGKPKQAQEICRGVREHIKTCSACTGKLLSFSPYRNPEAHRSLPYEVFEQYCDVMLPQVYYWYPRWQADPKEKLDQSYAQWSRLEQRIHQDGSG